ncbi:unnamed protein product [Echinostoma caproni]|uniref:Bestrophin homolog n=1 Tax=Echinostoma caproni TaxID=27848 RepID=A0A183AM95_9TREM|nr:unnamed protein product [Echinostoma caproni]
MKPNGHHTIVLRSSLLKRLRDLSGRIPMVNDVFDTSVLQPFYQDLWHKVYMDVDLRNKAVEGIFLYDPRYPGRMDSLVDEAKSNKIYCQSQFVEICRRLGIVPLEFMCLHQSTFLRVSNNRMRMSYCLYRRLFMDELIGTLEKTFPFTTGLLKPILYMSLTGLLVCSHPDTDEALWNSIFVPIEMHVKLKSACMKPLNPLTMNCTVRERFSVLKVYDSDSVTETMIPAVGLFHPSEGVHKIDPS